MNTMHTQPNMEATVGMMRGLGFSVVDVETHPQAFGSWFVCAEISGKSVRVVWDGREGTLAVQELLPGGNALDWADRWVAGKGYDQSPVDLKSGLLAIAGKGD